MLIRLLILARLLRLRLDVLVALVTIWMVWGWIAADHPPFMAVVKVVGVVTLVSVMYWATFLRKDT